MGLIQPDTVVLNWLLLIPFFAALCAELFPRLALHVHDEREVESLQRGPFVLGALSCAMGFVIALSLVPQAIRGGPVTVDYWWTQDLYHLRFQIDALSAALCALLWGVSVIVHLYLAGLPALSDVHHRAALVLAAQGCAAAACLSADLVLLFFLLELTVVCLWLLLRLDDQAAANALFASAHVGGLLFLGGALLVWGRGGDTSLAALPLLLVAGDSSSLRPMALLLSLGLLPKLAAVPGHGWLPDAARDTPGVALVPALLLPVAAGAALVRLLPGTFALGLLPSVSLLMILLGILGLWLGAVRLWLARGLLEFAAWLTVSQAGLGLVALGAGAAAPRSPEITEALALHLAAASIGLSAVWIGASAVRTQMGSEVIGHLGGLLKATPLAVVALLAGALSCAGLPLLPGFWAQRLLLGGLIAQERAWLVVAVVAADVLLLAALINVFRRVVPARATPTPPCWQSPWLFAALALAIAAIAAMAVTGTAWSEWSGVVARSVLSISRNPLSVSP
jgi:formate hydrogenlyase subunit 3/multisubunit Na+/H+ antiporter MnhD subunit